jgi:hypothetical protein
MEKAEFRNRLFFTVQDVAAAHDLTIGSAHVFCRRKNISPM